MINKEWLKDLREGTAREVVHCVGYLENCYLDDPVLEPMSLEKAVKYCYNYFTNDQDLMAEVKKDIRFDGKIKIIEAIKQQILHSEDIKLK